MPPSFQISGCIPDNNDVNSSSQCKLAEKCNISFGSVSNILRRNKEYLHDYRANQNQNIKRKFKNFNEVKLDIFPSQLP